MSSWAMAKVALNSTLGTPDFKPLDRIFEDGWRLVESEEVYFQKSLTVDKITNSESIGNVVLRGLTHYKNAIKFDTSGRISIRLSFEISNAASVMPSETVEITILRNGVKAVSIPKTLSSDISSYAAQTSIGIKKGDVLTFTAEGKILSSEVLQIRATPVYSPSDFVSDVGVVE